MQTKLVAAIIDDQAATAAELATMLTELRLDVAIVAPHGIQSAELVKQRRPELIFISIEEPVLRAAKAIEFTRALLPSATVVAYSSDGDVKLARRAMQAGASNFLAAPFEPEDLRQVVRPAVARAARQAKPRKAAGGLVLAVIGQKGGIGKTTIATNLAVALHRETSASTLIIDLDTRFGDVAVMLDVEPGAPGTALAGAQQKLDRDWFDSACTEHSSGIQVLPAPAPSDLSLASTPEGVKRLVRAAARLFDYVVLDTPGTYNEVIGAGISCADKVVAVTSSELASLKNTCLLMEHLELSKVPEEDVLIVLNHTTTGFVPSPEDITSALGRDISWEVPHDRTIRIANQAGRPVVIEAPRSPSGASLQRLAGILAGTEVALARQTVDAMMPPRRHRWQPRAHVHRLLRALPVALRF